MDERTEVRDQDGGEITFRGIGRFIKQSFVRILIYVLAVVILATLVVVPLKLFWRAAPSVAARIEFIYEGVNQGLDPAGAAFDKNSVKYATVVSSAISKANLTEKLKDVDAVRNSIIVSDVYSAEYLDLKAKADAGDADAIKTLSEYTYYPTRYDVSLRNLKGLNLSKQEAVTLLDNVLDAYSERFAAMYTQKNIYSSSMFGDSVTTDINADYLDYYDLYYAQLTSINSYIRQMSAKNASFRSTNTNKTFGDLIQSYTALETSYGLFKSYVVSNKVAKNLTITKNNLTVTVSKLTNRKTSLNDTITKIQDQIDKYVPETSTIISNGNTTIIQTYAPEYYALQKQLTACIMELGTVTDELAEYNSRLDAFNGASELAADDPLIIGADSMLARLRTDSIAFVTNVNGTVEDYFKTMLVTDSLRVIQPPVYVRSSADIPVLYIYLVGVIGAVIVAMIVTHVKVKNSASPKTAEAKQ